MSDAAAALYLENQLCFPGRGQVVPNSSFAWLLPGADKLKKS